MSTKKYKPTSKQIQILDAISLAGNQLSPSEIGKACNAPEDNATAWAVKGLRPLVENGYVSRKELSKAAREKLGTNKRVMYRILSKGVKHLVKVAA